jgi:hypothetical protein
MKLKYRGSKKVENYLKKQTNFIVFQTKVVKTRIKSGAGAERSGYTIFSGAGESG